MTEWLVERGIGETRAALVEDGRIVEARIELDGVTLAGSVIAARLVSIGQSGRNAIARDTAGIDYLMPRSPSGISEGAALAIEVVREALPGGEPWKRPLARATDEAPADAPPLAQRLAGRELTLGAPADELEAAGWSDLLDAAASGMVNFPGGTLRLSQTPAMVLIDVDGTLPPAELAVAGAGAAAAAIRRLAISGSIGIDLPTVAGKPARQVAAAAVDSNLPAPFERTAVNGFGFVQIVRPRAHASLLELYSDRGSAEARALLRRAGRETGARRLVAHTGLIAVLERNPEWLGALAKLIGGEVGLRADPALGMGAGYAEPLV